MPLPAPKAPKTHHALDGTAVAEFNNVSRPRACNLAIDHRRSRFGGNTTDAAGHERYLSHFYNFLWWANASDARGSMRCDDGDAAAARRRRRALTRTRP